MLFYSNTEINNMSDNKKNNIIVIIYRFNFENFIDLKSRRS